MKIKHPSWNRDINKILFGIEHELFIFHNNNPPTSNLMNLFYQDLCSKNYIISKAENKRIFEVRKIYNNGYIAINNDFCTHVLEIAFPPLNKAEHFLQMYEEIISEIKNSLEKFNITILPEATLPKFNFEIELVPHIRQDWYKNRKQSRPSHLWHPFLTTLMTSTQVHLNILDQFFYEQVSKLYQLEYLFPLYFSNSTCILDYRYHCARPLLWKSNQPLNYYAWAYPLNLPSNLSEYQKMISSSEDFSRDFSFITPRSFGTVEFRSTCSQTSVEKILEMISLRIAIIQLIYNESYINTNRPLINDYDNFFNVCENGQVAKNLLLHDLVSLNSVTQHIPQDWKFYFDKFYQRALINI